MVGLHQGMTGVSEDLCFGPAEVAWLTLANEVEVVTLDGEVVSDTQHRSKWRSKRQKMCGRKP